ncbi:hypothetical protein [Pseudomonas sp. SCB32]|uniref:hypothetical protein n=1 Tax=Pseudomonas sp. SCB32 TaxID=2653853 RepID=UPI001263F942|nr:hypothetical protein [Pseudomonas sp. SCB32]
MQVKAEYAGKHAFVATAEDVEGIWSTLGSYYEKVEAEVTCSDGIHRKFTRKEEISKYTNPKRSEIKTVQFTAIRRNDDKDIEVGTVTLGKKFYNILSLSLHGEEESITTINTKIRDTFEGIKPWYSLLATVDLGFVLLVLGMLGFGFISLINKPPAKATASTSPQMAIAIISALTAIIAFVALVAWIFAKVREKIFPVTAFKIGQGIKRHELNENIRWVVVVGLIVGIASAFISAPLLP